MRPTITEYLMLLAAIAIVAVVIVASVNSSPPVPYVRLDDTRIAPIYLLRVECVGGGETYTYARDGGDEIAPVLTGRPCVAAQTPGQ